MRKKMLLLAVSCKTGGLCPGGLDLDNPSKWIRIVRDDGQAGAVQGHEIDFAQPLDEIEFDGRPIPQGKQLENWVIDNHSCKKVDKKTIIGTTREVLDWAYNHYGYHGYWGNYKSYLNEVEFAAVNVPSESILKVSDVKIYNNDHNKAKIDFKWNGARYPFLNVSMTDQNFYNQIDDKEVRFDNAYIVISIPKEIGGWSYPKTGEKRAYKFVSKVFEL
jgi:hypothetical protein